MCAARTAHRRPLRLFGTQGGWLPITCTSKPNEVLPALLKRLGIASPLLIGHSDGATIALLHAARHPVNACVAIAPHAFVEEVSIHSIEQARDSFLAGTGLRTRLARHHRDVDNAFWQWNDIWLSPDFRPFDIRPDCGAITAPLLSDARARR